MRDYKNILNEIQKMEWSERMAYQIALAVYASCDGVEYSASQFKELCAVVRTIWDDMDNPNLQIIADCVCDCYFNLEWGYRNGKTIITDNDFGMLSVDKEDNLINAICDRM